MHHNSVTEAYKKPNISETKRGDTMVQRGTLGNTGLDIVGEVQALGLRLEHQHLHAEVQAAPDTEFLCMHAHLVCLKLQNAQLRVKGVTEERNGLQLAAECTLMRGIREGKGKGSGAIWAWYNPHVHTEGPDVGTAIDAICPIETSVARIAFTA